MTKNSEPRANLRVRTLFKGRVVLNNRFSLIDCTIRDLSPTGARLEVKTDYNMPDEFELEIPSKKFSTWARRIWTSGDKHGVMFFDPSARQAPTRLAQAADQRLQEIMDEARRAIAATVGAPVEQIKLSLELPTPAP